MGKIFSLAFILFCSFIQEVYAQKIDYKNIDYPYLEQLIKIGIDSLRAERKLDALYTDSILYLAAENHSAYLLKTDNTGHNQPENPELNTPNQRIQYFGGNYMATAENVAKIFIFIPLKSSDGKGTVNLTDYQQAAYEFVIGWKNSKGHYRNLMNVDYNITGISVSYNPKTQALYAVQTFGKTNEKQPLTEDLKTVYHKDPDQKIYPQPKPHRKHAWNIKSGEKLKENKRYEQFISRSFKGIRLYKNQDSIILKFAPLNMCSMLLRNKKDGLALEYISLHDYQNDSVYYTRPSRRNKACIFNGTVPQPLYKKDLDKLIKQQRRERKSNSLIINFGEKPKSLPDGPYEVNLIIIKDNKIQDIIRFKHLQSDYLFYEVEADTIPFSYRIENVDLSFKPDYDTISHKVFFERNETKIDPQNEQDIRSKLDFEDYEPYYAIITAFSSVEGPKGINESLYKERAENLMQIIKQEYPDSFPLFINTKENWDLFRQQLRNTKYNFLTDTTEEFARKFLSLDQPLVDLGQKLDQQRYVNLYLISKEILTEEKEIEYAFERYRMIYNRVSEKIAKGSSYIPQNDKKQLIEIQQYIFKKVKEGKLDIQDIYNMPVEFIYPPNSSVKESFQKLLENQTLFSLENKTSLSLDDKYRLYRSLTGIDDADPLKAINYYIMTIDGRYRDLLTDYDRVSLDFLKGLKKTLNKIEPKDTLESYSELSLYYHINFLLLSYIEDPFDDFSKYRQSIIHIYNHFRDTTISEEMRFKAAKFLNLFDAYPLALSILQDIYSNGTTNKEIIKSYLILFYSQKEQILSDEFQFLFDASEIFTREEWCQLFSDTIRINFQILDYEIIRDFYCTQCGCE